MSVTPAPPTAQTPHKVNTSTGIADPKVIAPPQYASGMFVSVKGVAARVTFDGSVANPATPNGLVIPAGGVPVGFPFAVPINFCSDVVGSSELDVLYVT